MAPIIIDDETKLQTFLTRVADRTREEKNQLLFIDIEGVNLGRSGQVAIIQILMPPIPDVFLIDVHVLGTRAFDFANDESVSLRSILESEDTLKVVFDIRNDSDALHACFGVNVDGIIDLQLVEYATRSPRGRFVNGLAKCIERDLPSTPGWTLNKTKGRRLFAPERGGRYEVFLERPLHADIIKYCEQDVMLMPQLLAHYSNKLRRGIAAQLPPMIDERVRLSKTATYNGKGRHMTIGPHFESTYTRADPPTNRWVDVICSVEVGRLCHIDDDSSKVAHSDNVWPGRPETSASRRADTESRPRGVPNFLMACETQDESSEDEALLMRTNSAITDDYEYGGMGPDFTACSGDDCGWCGKCEY